MSIRELLESDDFKGTPMNDTPRKRKKSARLPRALMHAMAISVGANFDKLYGQSKPAIARWLAERFDEPRVNHNHVSGIEDMLGKKLTPDRKSRAAAKNDAASNDAVCKVADALRTVARQIESEHGSLFDHLTDAMRRVAELLDCSIVEVANAQEPH